MPKKIAKCRKEMTHTLLMSSGSVIRTLELRMNPNDPRLVEVSIWTRGKVNGGYIKVEMKDLVALVDSLTAGDPSQD